MLANASSNGRWEDGGTVLELRGKHVVALGERDGIQGPSIEDVVKTAAVGGVTTFTQCFV